MSEPLLPLVLFFQGTIKNGQKILMSKSMTSLACIFIDYTFRNEENGTIKLLKGTVVKEH